MLNSRCATKNKTPNIRILTIRDQRVVLDVDLAHVYGVTTKRLNEQFRRNRNRFPKDFAFQLTTGEFEFLRSQIATLNEDNRGRGDPMWSQTATGASAGMRSQTATGSKAEHPLQALGIYRTRRINKQQTFCVATERSP